MIDIDGVAVVFEGNARLRWQRDPCWVYQTEASPLRRPRVLDAPWPDRSALAETRRRLHLLGRMMVVFDGQAEQSVIVREQLASLPAGVVAQAVGADRWKVAVEPLSWLTGRHRTRGLAFRAQSALLDMRMRPARGSVIRVEWDLVGSDEPLRFVHRHGPLGLAELREVIDLLYRQLDSGPGVRPSPVLADPGERAA